MESGFTLIETMVIIVIITIISVISVAALPVARSQQRLTSDEFQIRSLIHEAQRRAMNELREDECIEAQPAGEERLCSNVGLHFSGNSAVMFADTQNNRMYDAGGGGDYRIASFQFESNIVFPVTLVFESAPFRMETYGNAERISENRPKSLVLETQNQQRQLYIYPYGRVEEE